MTEIYNPQLHDNTAEMNKILENTCAYIPESSQSLSARTERLAFPLEVLGSLKVPVLAVQKLTQAPLEICFGEILTVINHAAQGVANIRTPQGQICPVSCYFITLADSGERKTSANKFASQTTRTYQKQLQDEYRKQYKGTKKNKHKDGEKDGATKPLLPTLIVSNPSMQGLIKTFAECYPSITLSSSEGGLFFGGYANTKEHKLNTITTLSKIWDGEPIDVVLKTSDTLYLENRRLALNLTTQPVVFKEFIDGSLVHGQGFLSRCLLSAPKALAGTRKWEVHNPDALEFEEIKAFDQQVLSIYKLNKFESDNPHNGLNLRNLMLDPKSSFILRRFFEYGESHITEDGSFYGIKDFVCKSVEHVLRIATTMTLFDDPKASQVPVDKVIDAIQLVEFYISEQLYIRDSEKIGKEESLLSWLHRHEKYATESFKRENLMKNGPKKLRKKANLEPVLNALIADEHIKESGEGILRLVPRCCGSSEQFPRFSLQETLDEMKIATGSTSSLASDDKLNSSTIDPMIEVTI